MEFGPRALGGRSILADARRPEMQKKINLNIKFREDFRPFAPVVLEEDVQEYFECDRASPYMLFVFRVKPTLGDLFPAITHVDYSARVQTVNQAANPRFGALLSAFRQLTGVSVLVNTSFNVRGEPIVNTYEEAYAGFMRTKMDHLVLGNYIFNKQDQPAWVEKVNVKRFFSAD